VVDIVGNDVDNRTAEQTTSISFPLKILYVQSIHTEILNILNKLQIISIV